MRDRVRQGMVIYVPKGEARDPTRAPEYYDGTYEYLKRCVLGWSGWQRGKFPAELDPPPRKKMSFWGYESWRIQFRREIGKPLPPGHFRRGFGRRNIEIMRDMLGWSQDLEEIDRFSRRKEVLYR